MAAGEGGCHDPADPVYRSHACKVERLRQRPFVVVATVDSGINPYHEDFHLPPDDDRFDVHPSEYIDGFPDSSPLELTLGVSSPAEGREVDAEAWEKASFSEEPLWVSGTNIIGARTAAEDFFDERGHGTGVASVAGGLLYGRGTPNVVLVAVKQGSTAFRWAANQPWIDVISLSFSSLAIVGSESNQAAKQAAASGKIVCAASGNTSTPIIFFHEQGPSSNVHVGAVDPETDEMKDYSGWPNDVLGYTDQTAAAHDSVDGTRTFGGTSAATPHVCALIARTISEARERVGDGTQGPHDGGLVVGPSDEGAMADGVMDRLEIEDAIQATARPVSDGDYRYVKEGYGLVSDATVHDALAVLFGVAPRPDRSEEDEWSETVDTGRDTVWDHIP